MCLPLPDGIHLNNNGAKIYTDIIYKYLKKQIFYDKKFKISILGTGNIAKNFHIPAWLKIIIATS